MTSLYGIINSLKTRLQKPNVYAFTLASQLERSAFVMCLESAHSLEEAVKKGKIYHHKRLGIDMSDYMIATWIKKEVSELFDDLTQTRADDVKQEETKSELMGRIIETTDLSLFEESKPLFKPEDIKYIEGRLKLKKK